MALSVALRFAYDGTCFPNGYARQPEGGTVEDALLAALAEEGLVDGSWRTGSRTDAGVSAMENVAACTLERPHLQGLVPATQSRLPAGLWILGAAACAEDWNPRHGALRTYRYLAPKEGESLDAMQRAAQRFVGSHDMTAFARLEAHRDPMRTVEECRVVDEGDAWAFVVASPGFLWNQVRRMVDAILAVGRGAASPDHIEESLRDLAPYAAFKLAAAEGLLLESVAYAPPIAWDPEAGSLSARAVKAAWQAARVRGRLMDRLQGSA